MIDVSTIIFKVTLLALSITLATSSQIASRNWDENRSSYRADGYYNEIEDYTPQPQGQFYDRSYRGNPEARSAIIKINGIEREIPLGSALSGSIPLWGDRDLTSAELIEAPPYFGFFFTSQKDNRFVTEAVDWNQPLIGNAETSAETSRGNVLLREVKGLHYYILDDPHNQAVAVVQDKNGKLRFEIMRFQKQRDPWYSMTRYTAQQWMEARWLFDKRKVLNRIALVAAPRGKRSYCEISLVVRPLKMFDVVKIGEPVTVFISGVIGLTCHR